MTEKVLILSFRTAEGEDVHILAAAVLAVKGFRVEKGEVCTLYLASGATIEVDCYYRSACNALGWGDDYEARLQGVYRRYVQTVKQEVAHWKTVREVSERNREGDGGAACG